jgi:hypothetical protein
MLHSCLAVAGALLILPPATAGAQQLDQLRGPAALVEEAPPPRMAPVEKP